MADEYGNIVSRWVKNIGNKTIGKGMKAKVDADNEAIAKILLQEQAPKPQIKQIANGDELMNFYKLAMNGDQNPGDFQFGPDVYGFDEVATSTIPVTTGYPGDIYNSFFSKKPTKYKPIKR